MTSTIATCRFCQAALRHVAVDLGMSPLCESFLSCDQLDEMEPFYPLQVYVCAECWLVQLKAYVTADHIFSDYAYFSSYSDSWVQHALDYTEMAIKRFGLGPASQVVELASNDGYLLQHFVARNIPVLGVEPAANVAKVAIEKGVPTTVKFFGVETARELADDGMRADLLVCNNVLAQVPELNDFVTGMKVVLKPRGVITIEFPSLVQTIEGNQFDQIYHEHFSYFSFTTACRIFARHGLTVFDVEELPTHGGSLRIYARHTNHQTLSVSDRVGQMLAFENQAGCTSLDSYASFAKQVAVTKRNLLSFLIDAKRDGKRVVGYGAPGKGNTLLNYCGIRTDLLDYTVDRNPYKQGKFLPGTHIPIYHPDKIAETKPDFVLILPWNLKTEIMKQMTQIREWCGRFVVPIPEVRVFS